jgi:hypothetical protein
LFHFSISRAILLIGGAAGFLGTGAAVAESDHGNGNHSVRRHVYQRHAFERKDDDKRDRRHDGRDFGRFPRFASPPVSAGWFQRPYPYHLDYYKMRYGGSYAPYFGNLYGPPQVVTAPPYYGPYYGGYGGNEAEYPNGYGPGYGGMPGMYPPFPNGMMMEEPADSTGGKPVEKVDQNGTGEAVPVLKP